MFCIFSNVRYSNPKLMHVGHQYMAQTFDPKQFDGLLELQTFHISPDKGLGIFTFDSQENMAKNLPNLSTSKTCSKVDKLLRNVSNKVTEFSMILYFFKL